VSDLPPGIPQRIQKPPQRRGGQFAARTYEEQKVDVGERRELAAAVATDRDERYIRVGAEGIGGEFGKRAVDVDRALAWCIGSVREPYGLRDP
jgi:hypothetical protein